MQRNVIHEEVADLGYLPEPGFDRLPEPGLDQLPEPTLSQGFTPNLYVRPNNFNGYVGRNESVKYYLEVVADNFASDAYQVFEVAWDGVWTDNTADMMKHLRVREDVSAGA